MAINRHNLLRIKAIETTLFVNQLNLITDALLAIAQVNGLEKDEELQQSI
jgi:hypothetical protein